MRSKRLSKKRQGKIVSIAGPVVRGTSFEDARIHDVVHVGNEKLLGEIIEMKGDQIVVQVYEDTDGLVPGEPVITTKMPLSVELGPGLLGTVYDGVQRPLFRIKEEAGNFITRGIYVPPLSDKLWQFEPVKKKGDNVSSGDILGEVQETSLIRHRVMVPPGVSGKITRIVSGKKHADDVVAVVGGHKVTMKQRWPVKVPRGYKEKEPFRIPLITGQRIYDIFFPTVKGGQTAIPGPFGAGKTMTQQAIAKYCDADLIVYIGCGERGNEMTEVLTEFPELKDPSSGKPLMDRTILIANTSNMPVAAREASIYTGMTIAEYYRDMGYDVALMADSTSRWAEAMREISGRLEEMPGEEGYPAYLATRLAQFYERAGRVKTLGGREGSVTVIGAVSPPGGDFSEPVTQSTLKIAKVFWALDSKLAAKRHYWAINWLNSYSLYSDTTDDWFNTEVASDWADMRQKLMEVLQRESQLIEIAQLVGKDSLSEEERFVLLAARLIREDLLQQNAFHKEDMYCPVSKQYQMLRAIWLFYEHGKANYEDVDELEASEIVKDIGQMKYIGEKEVKELCKKIESYFSK
ncbi:MAG: V-type ATP synthase subunit A [Candidatus Woesearchaeota archaeon]